MRKLFLSFFTLALTCVVLAQNIQLHYDLGRFAYNDEMSDRPLFTSTVEMFKPDKWGSTFFFTDMDYESEGISFSYWEIARELKFWKGPLSIHLEYNGGVYVKNAYLLGSTYTYNNADFSTGYSFSAMYKNIQRHIMNKPHNFQLTGTWYLHFAKNKICTFTGFADFWREKSSAGDFVFLAEPQFWLHLNKLKGFDDKLNLSIGTEVEISNNFAGREGFYAIPTAAIRWEF